MNAIRSIFACCSTHPKKTCLMTMIPVVILTIIMMQPGRLLSKIDIGSKIPELRNQSKDSFVQSDSDRRLDGKWFNFTTTNFRLYAYSAFYDDRPSLMSPPVIRITAISDRFDMFSKRKTNRLYCVLHFGTDHTITEMKEEPNPIGFGWPLNRLDAREYLYTCPTVDGPVPTSVSLTTNRTEFKSFSGIPVVFPKKPKEKRQFCICVQAAYGTSLDPYRLIEWLELQKILGVSLVGVYVLTASETVLKVLKHYSDENFVDLRKIKYVYSDKLGDKEFWLHLTPTINDCIYRHMYEFKRILVLDFDEIILPRKHHNLSDLVNYLDEKTLEDENPSVNFAFRNNYFFLDIPTDDDISSKYLTFLKFRKKVAVSPDGYSIKSIINPQACVNMHNHFCWSVTKNYTSFGNTQSVDPEIGLNQHYKKCHFPRRECEDMMKSVTQDDAIMPFSELLERNVKKKVKQIMGHDV